MEKNIILLVMDTARASETHFVMDQFPGSTLAEIASEGTHFTNAFSNAPWTLPSHTSMFTGTYTSKHGTHAGFKSYSGRYRTLAECLSSNGYQCLGVTNNAWVSDEFGLARGFDRFRKVWQYVQTETDFGTIKLTSYGREQVKSGLAALFSRDFVANVANTIYGSYFYRRSDYGARRTNALVEQLIDERTADEPFFLFLNYLEPHLDYRPPKAFAEPFVPAGSTYEEAMAVPQEPWEYVVGNRAMTEREFELLRALYRGEIAYLDEQLGELRSILERAGEWEETVVVVVGDHGENIGEFELMDHQYSLHDTVLHVPLLITGGDFTGGGPRDDLVQTIDIFPTLLESAGVPIPDQSQGVSLHPDAASAPREYVFGEYLHPQPSIDRLCEQTGVDEENVRDLDRRIRTIRSKAFKLTRDATGETTVFDTRTRPDEKRDRSDDYPEETTALESALDAWLSSFEHASADGDVELTEHTKNRLEDLGYLQ